MVEERVLAGRYRLVAPLGRGAFSVVWSAEDRVLDRRVAVKLLAVAARHPDMVRRLAREAHALARLTHPHVVAVYDAGLDGLDAYVVMELLAGPSLAEVLAERGPLPVPLALRYAGQAAAALAAAHAIGVVHRDVKPANLVLAADGMVKVVDLGIAALRFETGRLTATGTGLGTPAYLSPEQAAGRLSRAAIFIPSAVCCLNCSPASLRSPVSTRSPSPSSTSAQWRPPRGRASPPCQSNSTQCWPRCWPSIRRTAPQMQPQCETG